MNYQQHGWVKRRLGHHPGVLECFYTSSRREREAILKEFTLAIGKVGRRHSSEASSGAQAGTGAESARKTCLAQGISCGQQMGKLMCKEAVQVPGVLWGLTILSFG